MYNQLVNVIIITLSGEWRLEMRKESEKIREKHFKKIECSKVISWMMMMMMISQLQAEAFDPVTPLQSASQLISPFLKISQCNSYWLGTCNMYKQWFKRTVVVEYLAFIFPYPEHMFCLDTILSTRTLKRLWTVYSRRLRMGSVLSKLLLLRLSPFMVNWEYQTFNPKRKRTSSKRTFVSIKYPLNRKLHG